MNLTPYIGRLPYASEMFGVYRPMIGWASKRKRDRILTAERQALAPHLRALLASYSPRVELEVDDDSGLIKDERYEVDIGVPASGHRLSLAGQDDGSFLMPAVEQLLVEAGHRDTPPADRAEWQEIINEETLRALLRPEVETGLVPHNSELDGIVPTEWFDWQHRNLREAMRPKKRPGESDHDFNRRLTAAHYEASAVARGVLEKESCLAAALLQLVEQDTVEMLTALFYSPTPGPEEVAAKLQAIQRRLTDPFLQFDPTDKLNGVTVSPIGIVHLYRQYFFEFDSFLGPSVEHLWLPPGATVELIESSTRKTTVERTTSIEQETTTRSEQSERTQEEISQAVRQENRDDTKLGFSATVTQGWPGGSSTATGNLNLDTTQQMSREDAYKRMREQTTKLSSEIRNSFKTTFRTVTEATDTSNKRYVLNNVTNDLLNYELRRKMRQVGVQVQDVGTYLCWETFVDEPGAKLGLANLVHVAAPPDTTPLPNPSLVPVPERKTGVGFRLQAGWAGHEKPQYPTGAFGIPLGRKEMPIDIPDGYEVDLNPEDVFQLQAASAAGEGGESFRTHTYLAQFVGGKTLDVGLAWGPRGLRWTHNISLELTGSVALRPTTDRLEEIAAANKAIMDKHETAAQTAAKVASDAAFYKAAQERIEQAAGIKPRRFEDLREEERTLVYRALIKDLMAKDPTTGHNNYDTVDPKERHIYATVLNAIFDIDAMLYFVAPEWWKPRKHSRLSLGAGSRTIGGESLVGWSDRIKREDNYYITAKSKPARLGSSLGWLLQLDGDDNRNRFLNAPWVRAVIPMRPGKEEAAIQWLSAAGVEGADGLDADYTYPGEYKEIRKGLRDHGITASDPPTLRDALTYLCLRVTEKHQEATTTSLYPDRDGVDDDDKVWATPVEKVYEHGFYPLERSFRANPREDEDARNTNYQIMAQWTEILPTDQIVPVAVAYNPSNGRLEIDGK